MRHQQRHEQHRGLWPQTLTSPCVRTRLAGRRPTSAPSDQLSLPSVWREERLSLPSANVRAMKDALTPVRLLRYNSLRIPWVSMVQKGPVAPSLIDKHTPCPDKRLVLQGETANMYTPSHEQVYPLITLCPARRIRKQRRRLNC
jgi:hypothetical protein